MQAMSPKNDNVTGREPALKALLWDMDGTLIDSEPYWHQVEMDIVHEYGGSWNEEIGWQCSGIAVPIVAQTMVDHGVKLPPERIVRLLIEGVARKEFEHMPWIEGVEDVLRSLAAAHIPSVLVTASPRRMAENLVSQAPDGVFVGYVCSDDDLPKKPDPAPYLAAAKVVGVVRPANADAEQERAFRREMARCVAIEDSMTGLESAVASGATTIAQTGFIGTDTSHGPQFASISGYEGLDAARLNEYAAQRLAAFDDEAAAK
ncbi:HAD family hydrolase [Bifidobacterium sp. ESL0790]|uniref:HAD family hydrolase n=1 Tax=Bifidobacterium sp. ESL0790 TaxID=2983233 RepID=UPI0023F7BA14|nr:HAD family hydrolase [Bifidobacterium sp. ESL0790]WEV72351.1 HAD family hydrolase [Bifidobacterium sp. ESL0790]